MPFGNSINLFDVAGALSNAVTTTEAKLQADANAGNGSNGALDSQQLVQFQLDTAVWSLQTTLQTNTLKTLTDTVKNTAANFR
jgi:Type III secretion needle MxiH, YscF, SsaG, EprI, PscF, EscF